MIRTVVTTRRLAALLLVAGAVLGGCESTQDPVLDPGLTDGPAPTSDTLPDCPAGGPDATTPDAGCVGADGAVVRP